MQAGESSIAVSCQELGELTTAGDETESVGCGLESWKYLEKSRESGEDTVMGRQTMNHAQRSFKEIWYSPELNDDPYCDLCSINTLSTITHLL